MSDPQTANIGLAIPARGSDVGTWDIPVNGDFSSIDGMLGGVQTVAVGSSSFTLSAPVGFTPTPSGGPTQSQNAVIKLVGVLTATVQITLPLPGITTIHNLTTNGTFAVLVTGANGTNAIGIPQGSVTRVYNDGTNAIYADLPPVGSFLDLCTTSIPAWIANSTPAPYLYCNGATFSAATFPYLNSLLGGNTLPDLRGRSRFAFNDGTNRITTAASGINGDVLLSAGGDQNLQIHSHAVLGNTGNDTPDHTHPYNAGPNGVTYAPNAGAASGFNFTGQNTGGASTRHTHNINFTSGNAGAGGSQNMPPAVIAGIILIRAA